MKRFFLLVALLALTATAFALPSVEAVQAEVQRGNFGHAESMMRDVVAARPDSARAHYVLAEILAHNREFSQALQQARLAQQIAPDLGFTLPAQFRSFERQLETEQGAAPQSPARPAGLPSPSQLHPRTGGVPGWAWASGGLMLAALLWSLLRARSRGVAYPPAAAGAGLSPPAPLYGQPPAYVPGYGTGYGPTVGVAAAGGGMLGTGLAAAGGVAAGMLAERLLEGRNSFGTAGAPALGGSELAPGSYAAPPQRNQAADELQERPIDFGSGGDWGGGGSDSGDFGDNDSSSGSDGW